MRGDTQCEVSWRGLTAQQHSWRPKHRPIPRRKAFLSFSAMMIKSVSASALLSTLPGEPLKTLNSEKKTTEGEELSAQEDLRAQLRAWFSSKLQHNCKTPETPLPPAPGEHLALAHQP